MMPVAICFVIPHHKNYDQLGTSAF